MQSPSTSNVMQGGEIPAHVSNMLSDLGFEGSYPCVRLPCFPWSAAQTAVEERCADHGAKCLVSLRRKIKNDELVAGMLLPAQPD